MQSLEQRIKASIRDIPDFPKAGILFKDITPVLLEPALCKQITEAFYSRFQSANIDGVVGVESRGFLFGLMLAQHFNVPFIPVRKQGKLPYKTISYKYDLEYGSAVMEMHTDAIQPGLNYLIHDDLLATGGTAAAAAELVQQQSGNVAGFAFLVGLDFLNGTAAIKKYSTSIYNMVSY